eukprot:1452-Heterococcus_DN1.PRE.2
MLNSDSAVATTVATTAIASAAGDSTQLGIMLCMCNSAAAAAAALRYLLVLNGMTATEPLLRATLISVRDFHSRAICINKPKAKQILEKSLSSSKVTQSASGSVLRAVWRGDSQRLEFQRSLREFTELFILTRQVRARHGAATPQ